MEKHRFFRLLDHITRFIVIFTGMTMLATVLAGVFVRYVMHFSMPFTEELPRFLMVWLALFACPLAFVQGLHTNFGLLNDRLPRKLKFANFIFTRALIIAFLAVTVYYGVTFMDKIALQEAPTLGISMAYPYMALPISMSLFLLKVLIEVFLEVKTMVKS